MTNRKEQVIQQRLDLIDSCVTNICDGIIQKIVDNPLEEKFTFSSDIIRSYMGESKVGSNSVDSVVPAEIVSAVVEYLRKEDFSCYSQDIGAWRREIIVDLEEPNV